MKRWNKCGKNYSNKATKSEGYIYLFIYLFSIYLTLTIKTTLLTFGNKTSFPRRVTTYIYTHTYICLWNNRNNVNVKNDNSNSNERKWLYCLKEFLLVVCKFYIISMDIQRLPNSLFLIWRSQRSLTLSNPLVLNPIFLGLKTITIQNGDIQCTYVAMANSIVSLVNFEEKKVFYVIIRRWENTWFLLLRKRRSEKGPNTDLFLVCIFLCSDWIRRFTP